uniref:RanBD1 domain-containing protein n=1 Tax=Parastrongyloides trichosuri TaxID=131310 RepID=A0A0N4ZF86_PARTI
MNNCDDTSNLQSERETANIGDQISAYLKANTSALGELIRQLMYESNETRRQLGEVKNSLEQVHEGLRILGSRVAAIPIVDQSSAAEETRRQCNLEMDRLIKMFELSVNIKKEPSSNISVQQMQPMQGITQQQFMQMQQQQQIALVHQQIAQQQAIARMAQMQQQQLQTNNSLPPIPQPIVDVNVQKPVNVIQSQGTIQQPNNVLKSQLTQQSTVTTTPVKKEETPVNNSTPTTSTGGSLFGNTTSGSLFGNSTSGSLFGNTNTGTSIFGKVQAPAKSLFSISSTTNNTSETNDTTKTVENNDDEEPEDFEPNVEFKPVIPLPALITPTTGEEGETVLFEEGCKLFRFDDKLKEFKERGIGKIKVLKNEESGVVRVVMRREQVHKVCANFKITKGMAIKLKPNSTKVCIFKCFDNSDDTPAHVTLCAKFSDEKICDKFIKIFEEFSKDCAEKQVEEVVKKVEPKKEEVKEVQPNKEQTSIRNEVVTSSGEDSNDEDNDEDTEDEYEEASKVDFKIPEKVEGSWSCAACYTSMPPDQSKCLCCEMPRDGVTEEKPKSTLKGNVFTSPISTSFSFGLGGGASKPTDTDFTKSKDTDSSTLNLFGELKVSEKSPSKPSSNIFGQSKDGEKSSTFSFAKGTEKNKESTFSFASVTPKPADCTFQFTPKATTPSTSIFGGSKSATQSTDSPSLFGQTTFGASNKDIKTGDDKSTPKTLFGQSPFGGSTKDSSTVDSSNDKEQSTKTTSIFGQSMFGASLKDTSSPKSTDESVNKSIFGKPITFGKPEQSTDPSKPTFGKTAFGTAMTTKPLTFGTFVFGQSSTKNDSQKSEESNTSTDTIVTKPTPTTIFGGDSTNVSFSSFSTNDKNFLKDSKNNSDALFNIDTSNHKLFAKTAIEKAEQSNEDEDDFVPDAHFEPVIPLPKLIEVKTGEEGEELLQSFKVKLYVMCTVDGKNEWKERGVGTMKLLKNPSTNAFRIVMRRDQTQKLCANMRIFKQMKFNSTETKPKIVVFKATDCSDDLENKDLLTYCVKFGTSEEAQDFVGKTRDIIDNLI